MIDSLIKKYEDTDKNEYIPPREILQDLEQLKEGIKKLKREEIIPNVEGIVNLTNVEVNQVIEKIIGIDK